MPKKKSPTSQYYQEVEIPIRIIKSTKKALDAIDMLGTASNKIRLGLSKRFLKKAVIFGLILFAFLAQAFALSAFEAHVINVTAHICTPLETRTIGFWKNHPEIYVDNNYLPQLLGDDVIDTQEKVDEVFENANADEMRDMLKAQLLAMKFNIAHFGVGNYVVESENITIYELVVRADDILRDPNSTREEQAEIKNTLDYLNNLGHTRQCLGATLAFDTPQPELVFESFLLSGDNFLLGTQSAQLINDNPEEEVPTEEPPTEEPPVEEPPVEEPPAEELPVEEPPVEEPFDPAQGEPPVEEPPAEESPPAEEPPAEEEPPTEEPPAEEPPTEEPPQVEEPPAEEPPAEEEPPTEEPPVEEPFDPAQGEPLADEPPPADESTSESTPEPNQSNNEPVNDEPVVE